MHKPGTIVKKRYRIRHLLAEGGMAEVYLAERVSLQGHTELFALKRLLPTLAKNPLFADIFAYEASLSLSFDHPNIVRCEEFFRDNGEYYLAVEFVLGKEVGGLSQATKGWTPIERLKLAVSIGLGVSRALSYVHTKTDQYGAQIGIVHGDISPQNIMINTMGEVKLYDFGAAKTNISSLAFEEKLVRGNWRYMSPEQRAGESIQASSDVYSLCLILLEIVFLELCEPANGQSPRAHFANALDRLDLPKRCHDTLSFLIERGLADDRHTRLTCADLLESLSFLASELKIFDPCQFLAQILKTEGTLGSPRPIRRKASSGLGHLVYISIAALSLGLSIWALVSVISHQFEPKHQRILPVWQPVAELDDLVLAKRVVPEIPVAAPKAKSLPRGVHGTLLVKVKPWAEVFIDGQFFGSTPMGGLNLPEGQYLVQLRNPDVSAVALRMVKIYADKKTELIHNF